MLIKKFEAKIINTTRTSTICEFDKNFEWQIFEFTKSKIIFTKRQTKETYSLIFDICPFADKSKYTFDKVYDENDKKQFQITIDGREPCTAYLDILWWNKIKCNIIHRRYFIDREKEWFLKTLIAAFVGFLFSIIGLYLGYRQGYQNGIRVGQQQNQSTNR